MFYRKVYKSLGGIATKENKELRSELDALILSAARGKRLPHNPRDATSCSPGSGKVWSNNVAALLNLLCPLGFRVNISSV